MVAAVFDWLTESCCYAAIVNSNATNRIVYVPGKNPKPPVDVYCRQLLRCLKHGVGRADPAVAQAIAAQPEVFTLIAWNYLYYQSFKPLDPDLPWIDALLAKTGPTEEEVQEALSFRRKAAWLLYSFADLFPFLISLLPDPAVKSTVHETARYFENKNGIGTQVRELLKASLRQRFADGSRILLIGHSMGSVIAYDALWELWNEDRNLVSIDCFLTLGSPLGLRFVQKRLLGARHTGAARYPGNIRHWVNIAARGDLTGLESTLLDDFKAMRELGLIKSITDINGGVFNYFRNQEGLNLHRSYGYLVNPRVGEVIANWWKGGDGH
jgi:hypothetical protein